MEESLGDFIKSRRLALGMTQQQVADASGGAVSRGTVVRAEQGTTKLPDAASRRGLASALGLRHVDILVAAGELTAEEASGVQEGDTEAIAAVRAILGDREFTDKQIGQLTRQIRGLVEMMEG